MSKEYIFRYPGSKESFLALLDSYPHNNESFYYFDNYIVMIVDDEIHFGVGRTTHSGGNWFISKFIETDNQIEFKGTIQYIGSKNDWDNNDPKQKAKISEKLWRIFFCVLFFPVTAILLAYSAVLCIIKKVRKQPEPKSETTEQKLSYLMEKYLGCQQILHNNNS